MRRPWVAWAGLALVLTAIPVGVVFAITQHEVPQLVVFVAISVPFAVVGALVAARRPEELLGWLLLGVGVSSALGNTSDGIVRYALAHPDGLVSLGFFGLASQLTSSDAFTIFLSLTLLLLPNGRLPSSRWRIVAAAVAVLAALDVMAILRYGLLEDWKEEALRNPLGVEALSPVLDPLFRLRIIMTFAVPLLAVLSVAVRFRNSRGVERAQLRWIVAAVSGTGTALLGVVIAQALLGDRPVVDIFWGAALFSIALIPVGIGIAVMRYRLYEIDRVISRTLVYVAVTVVLGAAYIGLVLAGQALFSSFAGGSNLAIAASTLIVAALFLPVRSRVQRFVDRRFYRRRYDAQRTLESFGARLREQVELETLSTDLARVVQETIQPAHVSLWLRRTDVR
jgi:hypothetical protein